MKLAALALLAPLALSAAPAPQDSVFGTRLPLVTGGRALPARNGAVRFGWPGVYFEARFKGNSVTVLAVPGDEKLALLIDGQRRHLIQGEKGKEMVVSVTVPLKPGVHVVRVEKLTESQSGEVRLGGIFSKGGEPLPVPRRPQIEFIGDSHSVGYGNTSPTRECTQEQVHDTTDTSQAFGPVLAKRLGADYRVIAYSGYGVVRNYAGKFPGENLPFLYPRALPGEPEPAAADPDWKPATIVINLGTNDFSTPVHAGEAWADDAALRADYREKYIAFVRARQAAQPRARIVLMGAENFYADVVAVAAATGATPVKVPRLEMTGCHWHPSLKDHQVMAALLAATLKKPGR